MLLTCCEHAIRLTYFIICKLQPVFLMALLNLDFSFNLYTFDGTFILKLIGAAIWTSYNHCLHFNEMPREENTAGLEAPYFAKNQF